MDNLVLWLIVSVVQNLMEHYV